MCLVSSLVPRPTTFFGCNRKSRGPGNEAILSVSHWIGHKMIYDILNTLTQVSTTKHWLRMLTSNIVVVKQHSRKLHTCNYLYICGL